MLGASAALPLECIVEGSLGIRFYAGHPLRAPAGHRVGTLCVMDHRPRELGAADLEALRDLAALAEAELAATDQPAEGGVSTAGR
jgi:GAF domain-containing protein